MMTDRELFERAIKALEVEREWQDGPIPHLDSILTALRERLAQPIIENYPEKDNLAQPVPEPFAWLHRDSWGTLKLLQTMPPPVGAFPVYTAPQRREWVGLTDEDKTELDEQYGDDTLAHLDAIEAKLREKNHV